MSSLWGHLFRVMTFGESHGRAIGAVIDGCPAGISLSTDKIQASVNRRRPGQSSLTTQRAEKDQIEVLSGLGTNGKTLGSPIALITYNHDARSDDYHQFENLYRLSHSDHTYHKKYAILPSRGGGRSSARETLARVAAGSVAQQFLCQLWEGFDICAYTHRVGDITATEVPTDLTQKIVDQHPTRCPDHRAARAMAQLIEDTRDDGDSLGGEIRCRITCVPAGIGEPVFGKLGASLGAAMMSLPAARYFSMGEGYQSSMLKGSQNNDALGLCPSGNPVYLTNRCGGVEGGISNGALIEFAVGFKPPSTIFKTQKTITLKKENAGEHLGQVAGHKEVTYQPKKGRHDPCVLPRAIPIVEAMALLTLADGALLHSSQGLIS